MFYIKLVYFSKMNASVLQWPPYSIISNNSILGTVPSCLPGTRRDTLSELWIEFSAYVENLEFSQFTVLYNIKSYHLGWARLNPVSQNHMHIPTCDIGSFDGFLSYLRYPHNYSHLGFRWNAIFYSLCLIKINLLKLRPLMEPRTEHGSLPGTVLFITSLQMTEMSDFRLF